LASGLLAAGLSFSAGCATFIDDVTSHDFRVRDLFSNPDPMTVLRTQEDGDARAKAMLHLKEPKKSGGSEQLQTEARGFLADAATKDARPLCRLAAIDALGRFDDPRASGVLMQAYQASVVFPTDVANPIRCQVLGALGKKNSSEAMNLLATVAATPRARPPETDVRQAGYNRDNELTKALGRYDPDAQAVRDARLAAVRALGESRNPQAARLLIPILAEKDVALQNRAQESLQMITGRKDIPAEPEAWQKALGIQ
jgi:HEAT repeat protein